MDKKTQEFKLVKPLPKGDGEWFTDPHFIDKFLAKVEELAQGDSAVIVDETLKILHTMGYIALED